MLTRLLIFLCAISPFLRKKLWRWWYGKLAREIAAGSWTFMNYGYLPPESATAKHLQLKPEDEPDRLCIQLYEYVASPAPLAGANVLEVGSGRGGGSSYFARYHQPVQVTGMDYSSEAVAFCHERHRAVPNLKFVIGDAEKLPFPDSSFDVVVNVESSHCYGNVGKFFSEVARVLRPGGHFVFADLRGAPEMEQLGEILATQSGWEKIEEEDITERVAAALEADDVRKRAMINEMISPRLRPMFKQFAGVEGGKVCQGFQKRDLLYFRFVFRRKGP
jgi:SAM-dependent methyltransferase